MRKLVIDNLSSCTSEIKMSRSTLSSFSAPSRQWFERISNRHISGVMSGNYIIPYSLHSPSQVSSELEPRDEILLTIINGQKLTNETAAAQGNGHTALRAD